MPAIRSDQAILRLIKDVNDIRSALRRVTVNLPLFDIANENTPALLDASQDNYVVGNYDILRLKSSALITISGLRGGIKGRSLRIFNVGDYEIFIAHQSTSSDAANRIISPTGFDMVLNAGGEIVLYYDKTIERWISTYNSNADRISCQLRLTGAKTIPGGAYTVVTWDTALVDTGNFFDPSYPSLLTVPETGWYAFSIQIVWDVSGTGLRELFLTDQNDYNPVADSRTGVTGAKTIISLSRPLYRNVGDTMFARVWHNAGVNLDILVNKSNVGANETYTEFNVVKL